MTGIEMLRNLAQHCRDASVNGYTTVVTSIHAAAIEAIADQIERERACDGDTTENVRLIVGGVVDEMERHVLGVEGMEDSPVARWARELREALGALHAPGFQKSRKVANSLTSHSDASDVSMSAYDLLPQEDRDAIAWVRENGAPDAVKNGWTGHVPLENVKKMVELHKSKRERLKAHALWLERKCAERRERIEELGDKVAEQSNEIQVLRDAFFETCARLGITCSGSVIDDAQYAWREIARRLMPEGMSWPVFEDGEPVGFGDVVSDIEVRSVVFRDTGILLSDCTSVHGWGTCRMTFDEREYRYRCSSCGCLTETYRDVGGKFYAPDYCSHCGARAVRC